MAASLLPPAPASASAEQSASRGWTSSSPPPSYFCASFNHALEDILFCVDADHQVDADMKVAGTKGQNLCRLDAIKQAIFLFVHSKLTMHPDHRFTFATLSDKVSPMLLNLTSNMDVITSTVRNLRSGGTFSECDLSLLFQLAASQSVKSRAEGRIFRVILIYCRSEVVPIYPEKWNRDQYSFVFDALYLHDKPSQFNCPQKVYDALVEALERISIGEGYIYESGAGLTRILFKYICCLLAHPQQRCGQDDFAVPRDISKVSMTTTDGSTGQTSIKSHVEGALP